MKTIQTFFVLTLGLVLLSPESSLAADTYKIDSAHSSIAFSVDHLMISTVKGNFTDFKGTINLDEKKLTNSSAMASIKVSSIDTDNEKRDNHLRSPDFFDVATFPEIKFETTKIKKSGKGYSAEGSLTIKGVTKKLPLVFEFKGTANDPWGAKKAGFKASTTIDRRDFGITWNKALEAGGVVVGHDIEIELNIEATLEK